MPVPSKTTRDGSFWDLNRKYTEDDMMDDVTGGEDAALRMLSRTEHNKTCYREIKAIIE